MKQSIGLCFLFCFVIVFSQPWQANDLKDQTVILTGDIDHFWDAFDHLKECRSFQDSVNCIQRLYFAKGTDGFKDFINKYAYTPGDFVKSIGQHPRFFNSIRKNTSEVKGLEKVVNRFNVKVREYFFSISRRRYALQSVLCKMAAQPPIVTF